MAGDRAELSGDHAPNIPLGRVAIEVSDRAEMASLHRWLSGRPELGVRRHDRPAHPGELGTSEILTAVASSTTLVALLQVLPEFLRSRRSSLTVKLTTDKGTLEVSGDNADQVSTMVNRLLGG